MLPANPTFVNRLRLVIDVLQNLPPQVLEHLVDVSAVEGAGLEKRHVGALGRLPALGSRHGALRLHVGLVGDEHDLGVARRQRRDLVHPLLHALERAPVGDGVAEGDAVGGWSVHT